LVPNCNLHNCIIRDIYTEHEYYVFVSSSYLNKSDITVKIYRELLLKHTKEILHSQINFFIPYLLTGIQLVFSYQSTKLLILFQT